MNEDFKKGMQITAGSMTVTGIVGGIVLGITWGIQKYREKERVIDDLANKLSRSEASLETARHELIEADRHRDYLRAQLNEKEKQLGKQV